jgi:hypothetical protein
MFLKNFLKTFMFGNGLVPGKQSVQDKMPEIIKKRFNGRPRENY